MKMTKKIITCVLALAMIANVFAVVSFAGDEAPLTISFSAPKNVTAGSTFDLVVNFKSTAAKSNWSGGSLALGYNSALVSESGKDSMAVTTGFASTIDTNIFVYGPAQFGAELTDGEKTDYGWDSFKTFGFPYKSGTSVDVSAGMDVFKVTFKVADTVADGTKIYIGIPTQAVDADFGELYFYDDAAGQEWYGNGNDDMEYQLNYDVSKALVEITVGEDAKIIKASKTGDVVNTLVGWGNYNTLTDSCDGAKNGKFNVAVKATFTAEDLAEAGISFTNGTCNEIATLDATVKIGDGAAQTASTKYIYGAADGKGAYEFYVVITNITYGAEDDVEITFGGTLTAGGAISGETVTINLKDAFDAAVDRGLPTNGYIPA